MEWPNPRNVDEVISFKGLTGYYKMFFRNFSKIGYLITYLRRKQKKFEWIEKCVASFEKLNHFLTNALVSKIVDLDKEFIVCTYACKEGLSEVLM